MQDFSKKQIVALNKQQIQTVSTRQEETPIREEIQGQNNDERSDNRNNQIETEMKQESKGKINFRKASIVDESIKELTSAIKLLSNKMSNISESSFQNLTSTVHKLSESHEKMTNVVELLSEQIKMIRERPNQEFTPTKSLLPNKISIMEEKSNRIQERFQSIHVQPSNELVKYLKESIFQQKKENQQKRRERNRMINNWLGIVCNKVFSIGFLIYKKEEMKLREVKAFCSENMLRNIINLSTGSNLTTEDFQNIDGCLTNDLLPYFKSKYPQTMESEVNLALSKQIEIIDNMESNDYDLIYKSGVKFEINKEANYNHDIMKFTNYVVKVPQSKEYLKKQQKEKEDLANDKNKQKKEINIEQNQNYNQKETRIEQKQILKEANIQQNKKKPEIKQDKKDKEENKNEKTLFDFFEQKMNNYMKLICTRPQDRDSLNKPKSSQNQQLQNNQSKIEGEINQNQSSQEREKQFDPETKQKIKQYSDRVRSFSQFEIGQKLSKNFQQYSKAEMEELSFKFRSSAHIRVLTKWCEQLYKNFDEDYIIERQIPFRIIDGSQAYLNNQNLRLLCLFLEHEKVNIKGRLEEVYQNNHQLQSKISMMNINKSQQMFLKEEAMVGQFATGVYKSYENYLVNYLNILIHSLNTASKNFMNILTYSKLCRYSDKIKIEELTAKSKNKHQFQQLTQKCQKYISQYFDQQYKQQKQKQAIKQTPQLISFTLGDLIRCRYTSKEDQILTIYKKLKADNDIKIVRVKNRLNGGNRDILINALFKNEVMTEIQLCIKSEKSRFIECSNQFNHFIYELQRAQFGPISQMVNLWVNYDKRSEHFMERIDTMFKPETKVSKNNEILDTPPACCQKRQQQAIGLPFQCSTCQYHYFDVYESFGNKICLSCNKSLCINCKLNKQEIVKLLSIKDKEKVGKITVVKENNVFGSQKKDELNLVLLNLKSKKRKVRPFRVIEDSNKMHLFEKIMQNKGELNLIKTFKNNESYKKQIHKFLNENLVIQIENLSQLSPQFVLKDTLQGYFYPKLFKQAGKKQKDIIFMRGKQLKDHNIPIDINFNQLKRIDFQENELTDIDLITKTFTNIESANLTNNKIKIISKAIFELPKLQILKLGHNSIIKLPQQLSRRDLKQLDLSQNQIKDIPNEFFNFHRLKILNLQKNSIQKLPQNRPKMDCLEQFYLSNNQIEEIPNDFFNFDKLKIFSLQKNRIKTLPQNSPNMNCLEKLNLSQNQIQEIPNEFFNYEKLRILNLYYNKIKTLPQNKPNMKCLEELYLSSNQIEDIPNEFFNFDRLSKLNLIKNNIKTIPQSISKLDSLQQLFLQCNKISIIPSSLYFNNLKQLHVRDNPITKFEQTIIGPKLKYLYIKLNELDEISLNNIERIKQNGVRIGQRKWW